MPFRPSRSAARAVTAAPLLLLCSGLAGCGAAPLSISSVDPGEGPAGAAIPLTIEGTGFTVDSTAELVDAAGVATPLTGVAVDPPGRLVGAVSPGLLRGLYGVRVVRGAESVVAPSAYAALAPMRIVAIDVGQGDATLIVSPVGRSLLIDTGPASGGPAIEDALLGEGVTRLDYLVSTHYDADHIGGLRWALAGPDGAVGSGDDTAPPPGNLLDRGDDTDTMTLTYADYLALTASLRAQAYAGQLLDLGGGATARVVVVNGDIDGVAAAADPATRSTEENENCIGLLLEYGDFSMLIAGDLTGNTAFGGDVDVETPLGPIVGDVDVLHVNHHGSNTSSIGEFLRDLSPEASIVSVGLDNDYCHPNELAVNRLALDAGQLFLTAAGIVTPGIISPAGNECPLTSTYLPPSAVIANGAVVVEVVVGGGAYDVAGTPFPGD